MGGEAHSKMKAEGIFVGLSTIDIIYTVLEHPAPNKKIAAQSQQVFVGGPATNAAITFAFLGGSATLVTPAGGNPLSTVIKQECREFGIDLVDLVPDAHEGPPISSIWVDVQGRRSVVSANTVGRTFRTATVNPELLSSSRILMVDGHAMEACYAWAEAARAAGVSVVLDGGSWKAGTDTLLKVVDVAICSADFLPPDCTDQHDVIDYLQAAGVQEIAITHGPAPIQYVSRSGSGAIDVPITKAIDTTGAGDIFHGAFCFYHAAGSSFESALRRAAIIAADSCRSRGTREWMHRQGGSGSMA
jgi:sugar/nucleoside kinase (ribokinase family)